MTSNSLRPARRARANMVWNEKFLLISQAEVEAELRKRLGELGGRVLWDHEAVAATQDGSGVSITVRTGERESSARADWLLGCDGDARTEPNAILEDHLGELSRAYHASRSTTIQAKIQKDAERRTRLP